LALSGPAEHLGEVGEKNDGLSVSTEVDHGADQRPSSETPFFGALAAGKRSFEKISRWSKSDTSSRVWAEVWAGRFFQKPETTKP
jgi:hypothetical protein